MNIAVIGAGSWGTALSVLLAQKGLPVTLWVRREEQRLDMAEKGENSAYLPGVPLASDIYLTGCLEEAVRGKDALVLAVPSHALKELCNRVNPFLQENTILVNVAKGLDETTLKRLSEIIRDNVRPDSKIAVLSGPNHAEEVGRFIPTATVVASEEEETAQKVQDIFMTPNLRVYTNTDIIGVELGGALKNVIAIAAGICESMGFGDNTMAAILTRGLAEITRLGAAMGARTKTFSGLTGFGDLFVTCTSSHSRNRYVGLMLGEKKTLEEITSSMNMVAEGIKSTGAVYRLAQKYNVSMPISTEVYNILFRNYAPADAVKNLMGREKTNEIEEIAFD